MSILNYKTTYKLIKGLSGEQVFEVLNQLDKTQWFHEEAIKEIQWKKIKYIIKHAYCNVPYYKKEFTKAGITPDQIVDWKDLRLIPILTKDDVRRNMSLMIAKDKHYTHTKYFTSGSTGPSTVVFVDRNSSAHRHAARLRAYRWMGLDAGDRMVKFWGNEFDLKRRLKEQIKDFLANRMTFSTNFMDEKSMFSYYKKLRSFKPKFIYGFTSAIYEFTKFIINKNLPIEQHRVKAIITTSEPLLWHEREIMEKTFKCKVYNEYGCEEFGAIAYECPEGNLHLTSENVYVELEKQGGSNGRDSLILTELNNFIMPLIRYKLGDIGIISNSKCGCKRGLPIVKEISGRSVDYVRTSDKKNIHGISFDYLPKYFLNEILQFQIIQEDINTISVNIVKDIEFNQHTLKKFENKLKDVLGDEIKIIFDFKESIPRGNTGKFRFVVSKLNRPDDKDMPEMQK